MAVQTNAFLTFDSIGNKENLSEVITNLSPEETPISNAIKSTDARAILYEWQTDALAAADANNAVLEGDVVDGTATTPTVREKNYCQISRRDVVVSSTQEKVKKAGRESEMGYQVAKRLKELKRDIEAVIVGNQGYNASAAGTARRTRSFESFIVTNTDRGATGSDAASATDPATDGTQRAFTETMLKNVIQSCFTEGASPSTLSVGPFNKGVVSGFTGRAQARQAIASDRIQATASLYASDFGEIKVTPNRFQRERTALIIDPEYAEIAFLRRPGAQDLSRTGDSQRKYVVAEYALCVKNEKAHGMMAAIKSWWDESLGSKAAYAADTGAANACAVAPTPAITAYAAGQISSFFAANANTGATTLNVNALGAKTVQKNGAALVSGDITAGDLVVAIYDGTQFQLLTLPLNLSLASLSTDAVNEETSAAGVTIDGLLVKDSGGVSAQTSGEVAGFKTTRNYATNSAMFQAVQSGTPGGSAGNVAGYLADIVTYTQRVWSGQLAGVETSSIDGNGDMVLAGELSVGGLLRAEEAILVPDSTSPGTPSANNAGVISHNAPNGLTLAGAGSSYDLLLANKNLSTILQIPTGTVNFEFLGGGIIGSPTGGNKGAGTLNAQSVYDDNAILTCYVTDLIVDGVIDQVAWDARVPDRDIPAVTMRRRLENEDGEPLLDVDGQEVFEEIELEPARTEVRTHEPAARFAARAERSLDPDLFYDDMLTRRALPALPTREEWSMEPPSVGTQVQALIETIELLAEHDHRQGDLIKGLTARVSTLEGA